MTALCITHCFNLSFCLLLLICFYYFVYFYDLTLSFRSKTIIFSFYNDCTYFERVFDCLQSFQRLVLTDLRFSSYTFIQHVCSPNLTVFYCFNCLCFVKSVCASNCEMINNETERIAHFVIQRQFKVKKTFCL